MTRFVVSIASDQKPKIVALTTDVHLAEVLPHLVKLTEYVAATLAGNALLKLEMETPAEKPAAAPAPDLPAEPEAPTPTEPGPRDL